QDFSPDVKQVDGKTLAVTYFYTKPCEANAERSVEAHATFSWDPAQEKDIMDGNLPPKRQLPSYPESRFRKSGTPVDTSLPELRLTCEEGPSPSTAPETREISSASWLAARSMRRSSPSSPPKSSVAAKTAVLITSARR